MKGPAARSAPDGPTQMSHSRIFAGSGSGPTLTVPASSQPFSLEPLFDAVDSVMTCVPALASGPVSVLFDAWCGT